MKTPEKSYIAPRNVRALKDFKDAKNYRDLERLGIGFDSRDLRAMAAVLMTGDSNLTAPITTPSIGTPVQFLQAWLTGFVEVMTAARRIDELVGIVVQGAWTDEEVVQGILERTGNAVPYGDQTNVPLSSWNVNFERRTIVRFEEGMKVGRLEEGRAAAMRLDSAAAKREAAGNALEIERNKIGFYGFNDGLGRTFGFLNDPSLSGYVPVPNGASGFPQWATKTFLEITADIRTAMANLRSQSQDIIDPERTDLTLAIATDAVDYLSVTNELGSQSVRQWLAMTYPRARVVSAPELSGANGGDSVFYVFAESVADSGTDDGRTWVQVVPQKFMTLGVEQQAKAYVEDYSNATAGLMLKRPYAVVRFSGI
jgi:hypothetical protein